MSESKECSQFRPNWYVYIWRWLCDDLNDRKYLRGAEKMDHSCYLVKI